MDYVARCPSCGREYDDPLRFRCDCGSPLDLSLRLEEFRREDVVDTPSMWRYVKFFPYIDERNIVTLGEGWTPLLRLDGNLYVKMDFLNPTGSFKDRGASAIISAVRDRVTGFIAEDSSGNAGASMAAYAARAGIKARIYVPATISGHKIDQIMAYGAELVRVEGSREEVSREAMRPEPGKVYVGHAWHPIFRDGMRTLAYEIVEQLDWTPPDRIYVPVSSGTGLLGILDGLRHLGGLFPEVVACQTEAVSPLYHRFRGEPYTPPERLETIADALIVTNPPLLDIMVGKLREMGRSVEVVGEEEIADAFHELAGRGIFVEPTSTVSLACYRKQVDMGEVDEGERVVLLLTGSGLKTKTSIVKRLLTRNRPTPKDEDV